jgi:S-adenosylmethionine synthetase
MFDYASKLTVARLARANFPTKWQICQTFADIMGLPLDGMEPFTPDENLRDGTVRPFDCHLDTSALQHLGIDVGTVDFRTWW